MKGEVLSTYLRLPATIFHVFFLAVKSLKPVISTRRLLLIKRHTQSNTHAPF